MKKNNSKIKQEISVVFYNNIFLFLYLLKSILLLLFVFSGSVFILNSIHIEKYIPPFFVFIVLLLPFVYILFFRFYIFCRLKKKYIDNIITFDKKYCRWKSPENKRAISWGRVLSVKMTIFSNIKIVSEKKEFTLPLLIIKNKSEVLKFFFGTQRQIHLLRFTRFLFLKLFLPLLFALFFVNSIAVFNRAEKTSMLPAVYPGDWLVMDKISYGLRFKSFKLPYPGGYYKISKQFSISYSYCSPEIGDIVVFENPNYRNPYYKRRPPKLLIKRVIARGGDSYKFEKGKLYINGKLEKTARFLKKVKTKRKKYYKKNYYLQKFVPDSIRQAGREAVFVFQNGLRKQGRVAPMTYLLLGDNREYSKDSRDRSIGLIPKELIQGKIIYNFKNSSMRK